MKEEPDEQGFPKGTNMIIAETIREVREQVKEWRRQGLTVGLVPTMGALHEGHSSLVTAAARDCDRVVASVFINPTQFAAGEDLESYPRDFDRDCRILEEKGCHMVFHPSVEEMYPAGFATYVDLESDMTRQLCGKSRATHFKGVCTVVSKLFHIVTPDRAYFGEKDAQQLAVIRQMVRDQAFGLEIVGCPTVREADGLAKSSRNAYLSEEERAAAAALYRAIETARAVIKGGNAVAAAADLAAAAVNAARPEEAEASSRIVGEALPTIQTSGVPAAAVLRTMHRIISAEPLAHIEYIEAVDGKTLMPVEHIKTGDLIALAVHIGKTRLIDNFTVE